MTVEVIQGSSGDIVRNSRKPEVGGNPEIEKWGACNSPGKSAGVLATQAT